MGQQFEKEVLSALQEINKKLDSHGEVLNDHSQILNDQSQTLKSHSQILNDHSQLLKEHSTILNDHSKTLNEHSELLKGHSEKLSEHGTILSALRSGQEFLKAELSEMKLQNAKDFGEIKEQLKNHEVKFEILKDDVWENREDIRKLKKTLGLT